MKKISTLLLAIATCTTAVAQKQTSPLRATGLKATPPASDPGKTTGADTRVIAVAEYIYGTSSFVPQDSTFAMYTGNNGFDYATNDWKYDSSHGYTYDMGTMQWNNDYRSYQDIAGNRIMSTLSQGWTGASWDDDEKSTYTYTSGLLATQVLQSNSGAGLENSLRVTNTYNTDKQITQSVNEIWNSSNQWENSYRSTTHYNSSKRPDTITSELWNGSAWEVSSRTANTYTGGLLTMSLQQTYMGSSWQDNTRTTYTNDANGNVLVEEIENWSQLTSSWAKQYKTTNVYSGNDVTTATTAVWTGSSYTDNGRTLYTYNTFHRPLTEEMQTWNTVTSQWEHQSNSDMFTYYYYEPYTNDVKVLHSNTASLLAYPVPASGELHIAVSLKQPQAITVSLVDMTGKVVRHFTDNAPASYNRSIDVSGLPAGKYIIKLTGTTEQALKTVSIVQ